MKKVNNSHEHGDNLSCTIRQATKFFLAENPDIKKELKGLKHKEKFEAIINDLDYCNLFNAYLIAQINFFIHGD